MADDVLDRALGDKPEDPSKGENQQQEQTGAQPGATVEGGGASPAPTNTEKLVPLAALEAERTGRKDWKEKALRLEGEVAAMRRQQQPDKQEEQHQLDPVEANAIRSESLFLDLSERAAVKEHGKELVDKAFDSYQKAVEKNPALANQVRNAADPYGEIVDMHKRQEALAEIGEDPAAYRTRVRAELEAELRGSSAQQTARPAAPLPKSLADARSAGARGATWTGPTPLNALL